MAAAGVAYFLPRRANEPTAAPPVTAAVQHAVDRVVSPIVVICFARAQKRQHLAWDGMAWHGMVGCPTATATQPPLRRKTWKMGSRGEM